MLQYCTTSTVYMSDLVQRQQSILTAFCHGFGAVYIHAFYHMYRCTLHLGQRRSWALLLSPGLSTPSLSIRFLPPSGRLTGGWSSACLGPASRPSPLLLLLLPIGVAVCPSTWYIRRRAIAYAEGCLGIEERKYHSRKMIYPLDGQYLWVGEKGRGSVRGQHDNKGTRGNLLICSIRTNYL